MHPLEFRPIPAALATTFCRLARDRIGVDFPADYFAGSELRGAFDAADNLVGGYLVRKKGPFRTFASIPATADLAYPDGFLDSVAEINALFLLSDRGAGRAMVALLQDLVEILHAGGIRYGVFAVDLGTPALLSCYRRSGSQPLYAGPTLLLSGMTKPSVESIEYFDVPALLPRIRARYLRNRSHRRNLKDYHAAASYTKSIRRSV